MGDVDINYFTLRRYAKEDNLHPRLLVDNNFKNNNNNPLQIIMNKPGMSSSLF